MHKHPVQVAIVGGGPAGLMAAETLAQAGILVDLFDAMPSVGRKFLLAGIGGLNITHSEAYNRFCSRYEEHQSVLQPALDHFPPSALCNWVHGLGIDTFVGSSGRVFPKEMKAAPLLRAWLHRLRGLGVRLHVRHTWQGWLNNGALLFSTPLGPLEVHSQATILALGGASWPKLGSNGAWVPWLQQHGIDIAPLQSANCGFEVNWSPYIRNTFAGSPLKSVTLTHQNLQGHTVQRPGEMVVSQHGVEGSLVYAFSKAIRERIAVHGQSTFTLDLLPGRSHERVLQEASKPRGGHSLSSHLKSKLGISGLKLALLHEVLEKTDMENPAQLTQTIKALPITATAPRPLEEAISTAGGLAFNNLDPTLMLTQRPGTFVAGEMLDWEAPTGGYLLTACLATGKAAGLGVLNRLGD